ASRVLWTGRNLLNKHTGAVPLTAGKLTFQQGWLAGGEFTLDLRGLTCTDIADPALNRVLLDHLHGDDFFDTGRFPVTWFIVRRAEPVPGGTPGAPNVRVTGDLTLKAVTQSITFPAVAGRTPDGRAAVQAVLAIDRTRWQVRYGSGKLFHRLGRHLVNDLIEIEVRLVA
ncbi:MAG TPA: YceI family protein, partial [Verrucomicrobiota bacterium]|nr:YceI family protein [Verrucomicrobiota bacterium]